MHKRTEARIASVAVCATGGDLHYWFLKDAKGNLVPSTRKQVRDAQRSLRGKGRARRKG